MKYVVGYRPDERGADAIALAGVIARTQGAQLHLVYVVNSAKTPGQDVQKRALALVPDDVEASFSLRVADSFVHGLIDAAKEDNAALIIVGAASNGLFKRFTVGSVANGLLHASPVPVALAPRGYNRRDPLTRLTVMTGMRTGWQAVLDVGTIAAGRRHVPLRLVSVVEIDQNTQSSFDQDNALSPAKQHVNTVLAQAAATLPNNKVTLTLAHGRNIEEAIDGIGWKSGELVIVGSSRLAESHKIFLGSTANKILRSLPVPMVVVPRDFQSQGI
ncbi:MULTISPECIES: universal stress protein [Arthrobacter]|uniref:Universal stress protein UspA n=1 Tax=Arthrobacter psychrochitiniphilus TaxID=291045 RepID=A0A2V3DUU3_9MICC|nr:MULTISPECIES: universal stress protein [Arthrobacter]NYG18818.1 nucleotide-binding universal stress UspA family protein [Arthrobacter psychrochitiniphilus]PXA66269.1 universal stress protein UspA [Arthrobacter psychrochitiniphilus]